MYPPAQGLNLDIEAISGICGSISIACWIVVFSPQIIENFRRSSADGLSLQFIIVWLAGDVFNILGAVLQGVLPTMLILAVYYTIADIVLLGQCFYYRGFTWRDEVIPPASASPSPAATTVLNQHSEHTGLLHANGHAIQERERRSSTISVSHLSPATPMLDARKPSDPPLATKPTTRIQAIFMNAFIVVMVCIAGVVGWYLSSRSQSGHGNHSRKSHHHNSNDGLEFNVLGQVFGYFCAVLYLGSRIPQILLNYRRKSTEGISMLFFLFACIGNLAYVLSIFAFEAACNGNKHVCAPGEASRIYGRYILVNASWVAGSLGTLFLDCAIFVQFFVYRDDDEESSGVNSEEETVFEDDEAYDDRPLLERVNTG